MQYLIEQLGTFGAWAIAATGVFIRYFLLAGIIYFIFYVWKKQAFIQKRIQKRFPKSHEVWNEVFHSAITASIFAGMILLITILKPWGLSQHYVGLDYLNFPYDALTLVGLILFHDTYFYWMHRLMHQSSWLRKIHRVHHLSHNPTPMAAHSFHPVEAVLEIAFLPFWVMLIPTHVIVLIIFGLFSFIWNVIGHLGYELFPRSILEHPVGKWLNTSTHHNLHHQNGQGNYGLYFNFWDHIMGTNHKHYQDVFKRINDHVV